MPHTHFTCVSCSLPVETGKYACFYAASTSHRIQAIALNKARKLQVTSHAGCRLTYPRCDSRLLAIANIFVWNCRYLCLRLCGSFFLRCSYFCLCLAGVFTSDSSVFAYKLHVFLPAEIRVLHVEIPLKYTRYSGKFSCRCRQYACILREVIAASTQVNLPAFTGKLHVTPVNCMWGLFTCDLLVKLTAFAGNFARASFTVFVYEKINCKSEERNFHKIKWRQELFAH